METFKKGRGDAAVAILGRGVHPLLQQSGSGGAGWPKLAPRKLENGPEWRRMGSKTVLRGRKKAQ